MNEEPRIMLIRHAEKPREGEQGVDRHGRPDDNGLGVEGWQRAGALVRFFVPLQGQAPPAHLEVPRHLVAARPDADRPSIRARDTLAPLAAELGLDVDDDWGAAAVALPSLVRHLRTLDGPVLVAWSHDSLPLLANELLQKPDAPARWPEDRFDMVWVIERVGLSHSLAQVPQRLLAGDRPQAIPRRVAARAAGVRRVARG